MKTFYEDTDMCIGMEKGDIEIGIFLPYGESTWETLSATQARAVASALIKAAEEKESFDADL